METRGRPCVSPSGPRSPRNRKRESRKRERDQEKRDEISMKRREAVGARKDRNKSKENNYGDEMPASPIEDSDNEVEDDLDEVKLSERTHRRKRAAVKKILLDQNDLVKADVVVDLVKSDIVGMNITANKQCKKMSKLSPYHIKQISKSIKDVLSIFPSPGQLLQDVLLDTIFVGKLSNPDFCHIFGMARPIIFLKKGIYQFGLGFKFGLNEKNSYSILNNYQECWWD